jgi:glutamine synthetase
VVLTSPLPTDVCDPLLSYQEHRLQTHGIHTLLAQFTDVFGVPKGKYVPVTQLRTLLHQGVGFSGASVSGTGLPRSGPRAELYARGDIDGIQLMPWQPGYARVVCSGYVAGEAFDACPRQTLQRAEAALAGRGWTLKTGIEPEFFLLKHQAGRWQAADAADQLDKPSYDLKSLPRQADFLHALRSALESWGLDVLQIDHEDAPGQYEVNFAFDQALRSADHLLGFKLAAHALAEARGMVCSWMPKPFADQPGSGQHFHVSLWAPAPQGFGSVNLFEPADGEDDAGTGLSALGRQFVAGVLAHSAALCALAAPTVNSYKRLAAGASRSGTSWAPATAHHGPNNRTCTVRTLPGRFEWRLPDASANPYLVTAGLIAAGLDGIDRQLDPGPACTADLYTQPDLHAPPLPASLGEALAALAQDDVVQRALGATLSAEFLRLKRAEWQEFQHHVSDWERARYAAAF